MNGRRTASTSVSHGASSSLECQHAGLRILHHFEQRPHDSARIRDFVVACQSSAAGFGRLPGATPRLDNTLRAVEILYMRDIGFPTAHVRERTSAPC